jgi:cysteine-rich repeat protein
MKLGSKATRWIGTLALGGATALLGLALEPAPASAGTPSVCGDNVTEGMETCDDGNTVSGDGCSANCLIEDCGDGILTPDTEECDNDGANDDDPAVNGCSTTCTCNAETCGDGVLGCSEQCDDGNTADGDGCSALCTIEVPTEPLDKDQQKCVNEVNKQAAKIAKTQNKESTKCLKDKSKGKVADFDACLIGDLKGKVQKAKDKAAAGQGKKCNQADLPTFGFIDDIAGVQASAMNGPIALDAVLFGSPGDGAIAPKSDKVGSQCQGIVLKSATKVYDTIWSELNKSKKQAIKGTKNVTAATNDDELTAALRGTFTTSKKLAKAVQKLNDKPVKKCEGGNPATLFPGDCTNAQIGDVLTCVTQQTTCLACTSYNEVDGVSIDCDQVDDGLMNASCP